MEKVIITWVEKEKGCVVWSKGKSWDIKDSCEGETAEEKDGTIGTFHSCIGRHSFKNAKTLRDRKDNILTAEGGIISNTEYRMESEIEKTRRKE